LTKKGRRKLYARRWTTFIFRTVIQVDSKLFRKIKQSIRELFAKRIMLMCNEQFLGICIMQYIMVKTYPLIVIIKYH